MSEELKPVAWMWEDCDGETGLSFTQPPRLKWNSATPLYARAPASEPSEAEIIERCAGCNIRLIGGWSGCDVTDEIYCAHCWPLVGCEKDHSEGCASHCHDDAHPFLQVVRSALVGLLEHEGDGWHSLAEAEDQIIRALIAQPASEAKPDAFKVFGASVATPEALEALDTDFAREAKPDALVEAARRDSEYYEGAKAYAAIHAQSPEEAQRWLQEGCGDRASAHAKALAALAKEPKP